MQKYSFVFHVPFNATVVVTWLKYCRYGVKLYPINQSMRLSLCFWCLKGALAKSFVKKILKVEERLQFVIKYIKFNFQTKLLILKTFSPECILNASGINTYLLACKLFMLIEWVSEWVQIQYLSWMLNTNFCVLDEKYSRKYVYIVYFSCM